MSVTVNNAVVSAFERRNTSFLGSVNDPPLSADDLKPGITINNVNTVVSILRGLLEALTTTTQTAVVNANIFKAITIIGEYDDAAKDTVEEFQFVPDADEPSGQRITQTGSTLFSLLNYLIPLAIEHEKEINQLQIGETAGNILVSRARVIADRNAAQIGTIDYPDNVSDIGEYFQSISISLQTFTSQIFDLTSAVSSNSHEITNISSDILVSNSQFSSDIATNQRLSTTNAGRISDLDDRISKVITQQTVVSNGGQLGQTLEWNGGVVEGNLFFNITQPSNFEIDFEGPADEDEDNIFSGPSIMSITVINETTNSHDFDIGIGQTNVISQTIVASSTLDYGFEFVSGGVLVTHPTSIAGNFISYGERGLGIRLDNFELAGFRIIIRYAQNFSFLDLFSEFLYTPYRRVNCSHSRSTTRFWNNEIPISGVNGEQCLVNAYAKSDGTNVWTACSSAFNMRFTDRIVTVSSVDIAVASMQVYIPGRKRQRPF